MVQDEFSLLEVWTFPEPCQRVQDQLNAHGSERSMNLSDLETEKGHCVWCDGLLTGRRTRWCSQNCVDAATYYANPQQPGSKVYRLINEQNCACKACGVSFEDEIRKRIRHSWKRLNRVGDYTLINGKIKKREESDPAAPAYYHHVGDNTGHLFQTDHIIPVHKGGPGIDPKNLQVLCVPCHKDKTKIDMRTE